MTTRTSHGVQGEVTCLCDTCQQTFVNRCNLKIHQRHVHSDERLYPCDFCTKTFKRKKDMARHRRQVHEGGGVRHTCLVCNKTLSSKTALTLHKRTHTPALTVKPSFSRAQPSRHTTGLTQERSLSPVTSVMQGSARTTCCLITRGPTQVRRSSLTRRHNTLKLSKLLGWAFDTISVSISVSASVNPIYTNQPSHICVVLCSRREAFYV
uniref:C2H2-type domain-containing protein n=1 Tax=Hucho hucho TaxID=62062 RepID=A0A4W5JZB6_9TELE